MIAIVLICNVQNQNEEDDDIYQISKNELVKNLRL